METILLCIVRISNFSNLPLNISLILYHCWFCLPWYAVELWCLWQASSSSSLMVSCKLFSNRFSWQSLPIDPIHASCVFLFILFTHYLVPISGLEIYDKDSGIYCNIFLSVAHIKLVWDGHPSQISSWLSFNALLSSQNGSSFLSSEISLNLSLFVVSPFSSCFCSDLQLPNIL